MDAFSEGLDPKMAFLVNSSFWKSGVGAWGDGAMVPGPFIWIYYSSKGNSARNAPLA